MAAIHTAMRRLGACLAAWLIIAAGQLPADTIYSWTDEQGVKHFSNTPPSDQNIQFSETESQSETPADSETGQRRDTYDQMVESAHQEAGELERKRRLEAEEAAARKEQEQRRRLEAQKAAERQRLEDQIRQLRQRALSRTYSEGMRSAQIRALEDQIRELDGAEGASRPAD